MNARILTTLIRTAEAAVADIFADTARALTATSASWVAAQTNCYGRRSINDSITNLFEWLCYCQQDPV
jgi:hypothetical protein